uniref:Uncharacterized protein n=1 Tax=Rhizophora mucronata TaxID=61149 RepID=A0A2P2JSK9_RHIMU
MSGSGDSSGTTTGVVTAVLGAAALVIGGLLFSGSSTEKKTMKKPGRDGRMPRSEFEKDPRSYFQDLRKK